MFTLLVIMTIVNTGAKYPTVFFDRTFDECRSTGNTIKGSYADNPAVKIEYVCVPQK